MSDTETSFCRNCGAALQGEYCAVCGQRARDLHRPLSSLVRDFFDVIFSIEGKLWRSTALLLFAPGKLTRDYNRGKRARYVHPLRLYLLSTLLFLLVAGASDTALIMFESVEKSPEQVAAEARAAVREFDEQLAKPGLPADVRRLLESQRKSFAARIEKQDFDGVTDARIFFFRPFPENPQPATLTLFESSDIQTGADGLAGNALMTFAQRFVDGLNTALNDPRGLNQQLNIWIPRAMIILLPLFALLLRLHYWARNQRLLDQLIFSLHFHAFLFVLLTLVIAVVSIWGQFERSWLLGLPVPVYLWTALKVAGGGGIVKTSLKFISLGFLYSLFLVIILAAATGIGITAL